MPSVMQLVKMGVLGGKPRSSLLNGLAAYWNLNEVSNGSGAVSRLDASGNGHTLTDYGTTASVAGKVGNGALFVIADGTRLVADHHADFNIGNRDWEMCAWIYLSSALLQQIITKTSTQRGSEWILQHDSTSKRFQWAVRNTSNAWTIVSANNLGQPAQSAWYFIDVWHDAANDQIGIAVNNGTPDLAAFDANGSLATSTAKVCISSNDNDTPTVYFAGRADEGGIWKRLLTAAERTTLYNGGAGNTPPFSLGAPVFSALVTSPALATTYRAALIDEIWSGDGFPATGADAVSTGVANPISGTGFTNLASVDQLTINMTDAFVSSPYVFRPTSSNNKLAVVCQGHTTDFDYSPGGVGDLIRALSNAGYTVVGLLMPGNATTTTHNTYPAPSESKNYLKYFVEPCARAINQVIGEGFTHVFMAGLSGGGWTTHVCAALDPRILASVPVAGSLPLDRAASARDWEQLLPGLTGWDYYDLYALAVSGARKQWQILNYYEPTPYGYAAFSTAADYETYMEALGTAVGGTWALDWDKTGTTHQISAWAKAQIVSYFDAVA